MLLDGGPGMACPHAEDRDSGHNKLWRNPMTTMINTVYTCTGLVSWGMALLDGA